MHALCLQVSGKLSCLQTTWPSTIPKKSSHTVPYRPFRQISTRPSLVSAPLMRRTSPFVQLQCK